MNLKSIMGKLICKYSWLMTLSTCYYRSTFLKGISGLPFEHQWRDQGDVTYWILFAKAITGPGFNMEFETYLALLVQHVESTLPENGEYPAPQTLWPMKVRYQNE